MAVYHRQPTMDDRAYLRCTSSGESSTIIIDGVAVVHEFCVHKCHIDNCQGLSAFFIISYISVIQMYLCWRCAQFQNSAHRAPWWWAQELNDAVSNSSLSTMPWVLTRQAALPGFHTLIGAYINGHRTQGKWKHTYFNMFLKVSDDVISALGGFGVGMYPSDLVLRGYEQVLFSTLLLWRWCRFKQLCKCEAAE